MEKKKVIELVLAYSFILFIFSAALFIGKPTVSGYAVSPVVTSASSVGFAVLIVILSLVYLGITREEVVCSSIFSAYSCHYEGNIKGARKHYGHALKHYKRLSKDAQRQHYAKINDLHVILKKQ